LEIVNQVNFIFYLYIFIESNFDWTKLVLRVNLQAHQIEAISKIDNQRKIWGEFSNGLFLDMTIGYGKTIIGLEIILQFVKKYGNDKSMQDKGIIILCSSGDLRNQWCQEIKEKVIFFLFTYNPKRPIFLSKVMYLYGVRVETSQMYQRMDLLILWCALIKFYYKPTKAILHNHFRETDGS